MVTIYMIIDIAMLLDSIVNVIVEALKNEHI
jgi:hypothetical protein